MNLSDLLLQRVLSHGDLAFVKFEKQADKMGRKPDKPEVYKSTLTYSAFNDKVNQASHFLVSHGLGKGDVYNLHLPNCISFLILWFAGARIGAVMMPTNILASANEMDYLLSHSGSKICFTTEPYRSAIGSSGGNSVATILCDPFTDTPFAESFESQLQSFPITAFSCPANATDLAAIMYTSGTTSKPKGVMVTHANYLKAGQTVADELELADQDRQLVVMPLFHGNAQYYSIMSALIVGASIALMDRFSASLFFEKCIDYDCTVSSLFAAPLRMILAQPENPKFMHNRLRILIYAQNISQHQLDEWHTRFQAPLSQLWGMTETMGPPLMNPYRGERRNMTIGKPIGGYDVRLIDNTGSLVAQGEEGEIIVAGEAGLSLMQGYFRNPQATAATLQNGWLHTGDNAVQDADGYFRFVDRIKDMIKRSGENVSAGEVESVLQQHAAVFECAVVGVPDPVRDESIVAVVVLRKDIDANEAELIAHCQKKLAKFRVPEKVIFVRDLPKTSVGKIQKHLIKQRLLKEPLIKT